MYKKTWLSLILISFSFLLVIGCDDDSSDPVDPTKTDPNVICNMGLGLTLEKIDWRDFSHSFHYLESTKPGEIGGFARFELYSQMAPCDVLQIGMVYTTDGSVPTRGKNGSVDNVLTNGADPNEIGIYSRMVYISHQAIEAYSQPPRYPIFPYIIHGMSTEYFSDLNAHLILRNQQYEDALGNMSASEDPSYRLTMVTGWFESMPKPPEGAKVRFYLRSLKSRKTVYTDMKIFSEEEAVNTLPAAKVDQSIVPTDEPLVYEVNTEIKNPKQETGFVYTTSQEASLALLEDNDASGPEWHKVFISAGELIYLNNSIYSFSKEVALENGLVYYIASFTSDDATLDPDNTTFSFATPITPNTGEPVVSITASESGVNIAAIGEVINNGGTAITAYGFNLYNSANPDAVIDSKPFNGVPGNFTHSFNSLPNGSYIVEAYATNSNGITGYAIQTVIINGNLVITIDDPASADGFTWMANFTGHITNPGTSPITNYGFKYTHPANIMDPTEPTTYTANAVDVDGDLNNFTFSKDSISLYPGLHKIKAFATNANGTTYSTEKTFTVE